VSFSGINYYYVKKKVGRSRVHIQHDKHYTSVHE
jgi:hypothetical protein